MIVFILSILFKLSSLDNQTIISKLHILGQKTRVAFVHHVVVEMRQERSAWVYAFDIFKSFGQAEVCCVRPDSHTVEHKYIEIP